MGSRKNVTPFTTTKSIEGISYLVRLSPRLSSLDRHSGLLPIWYCCVYARSSGKILYFGDRASRYKFLLITNLTHFFVYLFYLAACFEHHNAHHHEIELY